MPLLSLCSSAPRLSSGRYGRKVLSNVPSQKASDMMIAVLNNRWTLHIFFVAIIAILVPAAVYADCPSGQTCDVGIGSVEYTVLGPCDYSKFSTDPSACTIVTLSICVSACANPYNPPPPPPPPPLCVSGAVFCSTPDNILQDPDAQAAVRPLELEARQHIAALRGVPDDKLNVYWSRGEIRAYMYLRLLQMANSQSALSPDDQAAVDYYTNAIKQDRIKVANTALSLYATWLASPCTFQVPVGDPESYLQEPATAAACSIPPNSPVCLLGQGGLTPACKVRLEDGCDGLYYFLFKVISRKVVQCIQPLFLQIRLDHALLGWRHIRDLSVLRRQVCRPLSRTCDGGVIFQRCRGLRLVLR